MRMNNKGYYDFVEYFATGFFTLLLLLLAGIPLFGFINAKESSRIESRIYNQKYGTNYTEHDFFWSGSTIKEYLNGGKQNTQNININGAIPVKIAN